MSLIIVVRVMQPSGEMFASAIAMPCRRCAMAEGVRLVAAAILAGARHVTQGTGRPATPVEADATSPRMSPVVDPARRNVTLFVHYVKE